MSHLSPDQLDPSGDVRAVAHDAGAFGPASDSRRDLFRKAGIGGAGLVAGSTMLGLLSPFEAWAQSSTGAYSRNRKSAANDVRIANFALTLEYLEAAFYAQAVAAGGLTDPDIAEFARVVADHEATHVSQLRKVLGNKAVSAPKVDFGAAVTDQNTFLKTAHVLEPVGVAAYAGAGPYIRSFPILRAALSIHSVEANHAAWASTLLKLKRIDTSVSPAPFANNPVFGYRRTLREVEKTGFVKG